MFSVLTGFGHDAAGVHTLEYDRVHQYTEDHIVDQFNVTTELGRNNLISLPCIALPEAGLNDESPAKLGSVSDLQIERRELRFRFTPDLDLPVYDKDIIYDLYSPPNSWCRTRTQWAVYEGDLYRKLLGIHPIRRLNPTAFTLPEYRPLLSGVAVMMPFNAAYDNVYAAIQRAAQVVGQDCQRADNIWNQDVVVDDIAELIDSSKIVVCDCTGKNPNVFYELGIAHTLGQATVLITQNNQDIPFDVGHQRYLPYLSNAEGLGALENALAERFRTILNR